MNPSNAVFPKTSFKQKLGLILAGTVISILLLETILRLGGVLYLAVQEYRNKASVKEKGTYRIMCLGESTTALGGDNAYPAQLERILNEKNKEIKFSVVNKGIPGTHSTAILSQLEENVNQYKPDMVVAMMGINDEGRFTPYKDIPDLQMDTFLKHFKTFKLVRFIYLNFAVRFTGKDVDALKKVMDTEQSEEEEEIDEVTEAILEKEIVSDPENEDAYFELGMLYQEGSDHPRAVEMFENAIELDPQNAEFYLELADSYVKMKDFKHGIEKLKETIALDPQGKLEESYTLLGSVYNEQGKFEEAEEAYLKIVKLRPDSFDLHFEAGNFYKSHAKLDQALAMYKKALELTDEKSTIYGALAAVYEDKGEYNLAKEYYKKANEIRLEGFNQETRHNYLELKEILDGKHIKLVAVQYPVRSVESLKKIFEGEEGITFVDNEKTFKDVLKKASYEKYFTDNFAGDFGHATYEGNRFLAENIAKAILSHF